MVTNDKIEQLLNAMEQKAQRDFLEYQKKGNDGNRRFCGGELFAIQTFKMAIMSDLMCDAVLNVYSSYEMHDNASGNN